MTDLRELLHATAAEGSDAVDLAEDLVVERIRHRRIRNRRFAVGGVVLTAAAVIAGTTWIVHPGDGQPPSASGPAPRIVRSDVDNPSGMEALLRTTLTVDASGCVQAGSGHPAVTLVWPRGYTVRGDAKSFEILGPANNVVARSGVPLDIGGGGADSFKDTWTGRDCRNGHAVWMVGHVGPTR
ncbi:hypothetical protein EV651_101595 [Kribbella sp. VKM Ac-2571]|uniref:hypothetical protein n=1 Tax=Kribbella sp. VKM Ac-2571 TaxID=2512222 RepID=UPI00105DE07B|nr:hypothetical protein [Kribbella sp. VKM Ac-2571]TDO69550.1 hypothetical protein EV651_101595 [Kribbella sp. VKM Ac-2571]